MAVQEEPVTTDSPGDTNRSVEEVQSGQVEAVSDAEEAEASPTSSCDKLEDAASLSTNDPDALHEASEEEPELVEVGQSKPVKLLFLDMDGPVAPYVRGRQHQFELTDSLTDEPYVNHFNALMHIIDESGGPDVVKVVLSSNWRTMNERVAWLAEQFSKRGVDIVGHTDVVHVHPAMNDMVRRDIELYRAVHYRTLGQGGPFFDKETGGNKFAKYSLPADWDVKAWVAIDDLPLDAVSCSQWSRIQLFAGFIPVADDKMGPAGWLQPTVGFPEAMGKWFAEFKAQHFVQVNMHDGIANTAGAVEKAIGLLNADSNF